MPGFGISPFLRRGGSASPYNPSKFGAVWAYHAFNTGITLDGSHNISQWSDQSGNNRHFVNATAADRPNGVYGTANFDATQQLKIAGVTNPSSYTMIAVVKLYRNDSQMLGLYNATGGYRNLSMNLACHYNNGADYISTVGDGTNYTNAATKTNRAATGWYHLVKVRYTNGQASAEIFVNGQNMKLNFDNAGGAGIGANVSASVTGTYYAGGFVGGGFTKFELAAHLIYEEALSDANLTAAGNGLMSDWLYQTVGTYKETTFTDPVDFNASFTASAPSAVTVTAGGLIVDGTTANTVVLKTPLTSTAMWHVSGSFVVGTTDANSDGFSIGTETGFKSWHAGLIVNTTASRGKINHWSGTSLRGTSTDHMTVSDGDEVFYNIRFINNLFISEYWISTGPNAGAWVEYSTEIDFSTAPAFSPATSTHFGFYNFGGVHTMKSLKAESDAPFAPDFAFVGDSNIVLVGQGYPGNGWIYQAINDARRFARFGGSAETTVMIEARVAEIIAIKPKKVVMLEGINDFYSGTIDINASFAAIDAQVTAFEAAGIEVILCELFPNNDFDVNPFNTRLHTTYGGTHTIVPFYAAFKNASTTGWNTAYTDDFIHINSPGAPVAKGVFVAAVNP